MSLTVFASRQVAKPITPLRMAPALRRLPIFQQQRRIVEVAAAAKIGSGLAMQAGGQAAALSGLDEKKGYSRPWVIGGLLTAASGTMIVFSTYVRDDKNNVRHPPYMGK